jgi:hypothetical protein
MSGFITLSPKQLANYYDKVYIPLQRDSCWEWTGCINNDGYGTLGLFGKGQKAHRIAFAIRYGYLSSKCICHHCDNPKCVNPDHLFEATHTDNMRDKEAKGRGRVPRLSGEEHGQSKLTWAQVREIRRLYQLGGTSHVKLGKLFNVSANVARCILHNCTWRE